MAKKLIWLTLLILVTFFSVRIYYRLTDDFNVANMTYEIPFNPEWEASQLTPAEQAELKGVLHQPFSYVGKGSQSYVFVSQDNKYVIKFFKFKHLKPKWWVDALPSLPYLDEYRQWQAARKKRLLNSVFSGYKLAYDVHKEEAGLVFLHLNKTSDLNVKVTLIDKIGRKHILNLDPIVFIIQRNAKTTREVLAEALEKGDMPLVKRGVAQIFDLYRKEYSKGIYDRDHGVLHNTGFVGDNPIHLDVGKLSKDSNMQRPEVFRGDLEKIVVKYDTWLEREYPEAHTELMVFIRDQFSKTVGEKVETSAQ